LRSTGGTIPAVLEGRIGRFAAGFCRGWVVSFTVCVVTFLEFRFRKNDPQVLARQGRSELHHSATVSTGSNDHNLWCSSRF